MTLRLKRSVALVATALIAGSAGSAFAQQHDEHGEPPRAEGHPAPHAPVGHPVEPHAGPSGYQRPAAPQGWDARPKTVDRAAYQHNFQAARSYKVGPYQRPSGWVNRHWGYGDRLPRAYWGAQYLLADYWLFGLEVPPVDYEWVRVGADALLINVSTGEVLQAEYGVFG
jgi:Ni/Co efflux regulator RcnB